MNGNGGSPEAEYWQDGKGPGYYEEDKAAATSGDPDASDEHNRWVAGNEQRAADYDAEWAEAGFEAETEELYEKLKESGAIPEADADEQGYSVYYDLLSQYVRYGSYPTWEWEDLDREHASPEDVAAADALKDFYEKILEATEEPEEE